MPNSVRSLDANIDFILIFRVNIPLCNKGDEATTDLLLTVGAELLDISPDKMLEMITEGF